ncbi:MAG: EamA family transporter [Telluria sp.]
MSAAVPDSRFAARDYLAAVCVVLVWGTNFIAMKFALRELTPFQLGAVRYVFASLPLVFLVRPPRLRARWVLAYGLCQGVGQFSLLFFSLRVGMSAALASVLMQTQVFFTAFFGFLVLHERPGKALRQGLFLAGLGLGCFVANYLRAGAGTGGTTLAGFLLCLGAACMWAASNIVVRLARHEAPEFGIVPFMAWISLVPIVPFAVLSLLFDPAATRVHWPQLHWASWLSAAYLGWIATILAYALWTGLLTRHAANKVAPFSLGVPVVGITMGMLVLGDEITAWQWAGIALVVAALARTLSGGRAG